MVFIFIVISEYCWHRALKLGIFGSLQPLSTAIFGAKFEIDAASACLLNETESHKRKFSSYFWFRKYSVPPSISLRSLLGSLETYEDRSERHTHWVCSSGEENGSSKCLFITWPQWRWRTCIIHTPPKKERAKKGRKKDLCFQYPAAFVCTFQEKFRGKI